MKPYHVNLGRFTLIGRVTVTEYGGGKSPHSRKLKPKYRITSVWVPTYGPTLDGKPRREWMIQAPRRAWPEAARCDGHDVHVTATFGANPHSIGATAYRAVVTCADEAEHVLQALIRKQV